VRPREPETNASAVREVMAVMVKLGTIAFGGPAVHVAMLRDEAVRRRRWLRDEDFLDLFGAVSVLPGPTSTQLAIVLSRRRAGLVGLVIGGACFIAPAMTIVLALAWAYERYGTSPSGAGLLYGVEPVVIAIVAVALRDLARTALTRRWLIAVGLMATVAYFAGTNVLLPLLGGGLVVTIVENRDRLALGALVWLPVVPALTATRTQPSALHVFEEFAKLGVIVFGSGYVLLAFLRADLVTQLHWLTEQQVLDAVTAGQVTPGPLFTTATFVGYLLGGVPLALVATAGIFLPSFFMVAALAPLVGRIRRSAWLGPALDGVTVAALGLMAGVTIDLARAAITDPLTAGIAAVGLAVLLWKQPSPVWLIGAGAAIGIAHSML
jgi:chromate transporter